MTLSLDALLRRIAPLDRSQAPAVQARLDNLTKPRGSLGRLEDLVVEGKLENELGVIIFDRTKR